MNTNNWKELKPPRGYDVFLPSNLQDDYRIFFKYKTYNDKPVNWKYEVIDSVYHGRGLTPCIPTFAPIIEQHYGVPLVTRVIEYKRPEYLLGSKIYKTPKYNISYNECVGKDKIIKPEFVKNPEIRINSENVSTALSNQNCNTKSLKKVKSFESTDWRITKVHDKFGSRTKLTIYDTCIMITPLSAIHIEKVDFNHWFETPIHSNAVKIMSHSKDSRPYFIAYSNQIPRTHALIGDYSVHVDDAVTLEFSQI